VVDHDNNGHMPDKPPDAPGLRIVIVDADRRVRQSLAGLLTLAGVPVVATAGAIPEALAIVEQVQPAVVLVDPRLPDIDAGEALIAATRDLAPGATVILMGWSDALERPGLIASADGYLPKASAPEEFVAAALAACGCEALA
jgi:two-component system, NarL family, nitrate/nitrite response regulator NarL